MIDEVIVDIESADGGRGVVSFRREAHVPRGGPDGGDGGAGGGVLLEVDPSMRTLLEYKTKRRWVAERGGDGARAKRTGRAGADLTLRVPVGTQVWLVGRGRNAEAEEELIGDLVEPGMSLLVAKGGEGGRGNVHFASSTNRTPLLAEAGEQGEAVTVKLTLKLMADVGIVGLPNAGKSTLLAALTRATPKIGAYPFTTLEPNLGVASLAWDSFVLADIPGLVEGAHEGRGLGDEFLRHIERTAVLLHVVDGSEPDPVASWRKLNHELEMFSAAVAAKPQIVVVNKSDLPEVAERRRELEGAFARVGVTVSFISAMQKEGTGPLLRELARQVRQARRPHVPPSAERVPVLRPSGVARPRVERVGEGVWRLHHNRSERIAAGSDLGDAAVVTQFQAELRRLGVMGALEAASVQGGDTLLVDGKELEWA